MNFDTIWYWLIAIVIGVLCAFIGYALGKRKRAIIDSSKAIKALEGRNKKLQADLEACNKKMSGTPRAKMEGSSLTSATHEFAFDATAAKAVFGKHIKQDDLKIVEGIGPKIEGLFHNFGIKTWKALSEVPVNKCQEVLNSGGKRYRIHDPSSWPMQARMAHEGKWKELMRWQDEHKSGKF